MYPEETESYMILDFLMVQSYEDHMKGPVILNKIEFSLHLKSKIKYIVQAIKGTCRRYSMEKLAPKGV